MFHSIFPRCEIAQRVMGCLHLVVWSLILAVMLYPMHQRLAAKLGGHQGRTATVLVLACLLVISVPTVIIDLHSSGTAEIPIALVGIVGRFATLTNGHLLTREDIKQLQSRAKVNGNRMLQTIGAGE